MRDPELVLLGLSAHAMAHRADTDTAWQIAEEVLAANPDGSLRELSEAVAARAFSAAWGGLIPPPMA